MQIYRSALFEVLQTGNITGNVYENSGTKQIKIISDKGFYSSETFPALHEQNMNRPKWRNAVPYKRNNEPYSGSPFFSGRKHHRLPNGEQRQSSADRE